MSETLTCDFVYEIFNGGYSPKFKCLDQNGKKVKVKYFNGDNRELFGEVAASGLFASLGFLTDQNRMVQVDCRNCPPNDPWSWVDPRNGILQKGLAEGKTINQIKAERQSEITPLRHFAFAAVEKKVKGEQIGLWGWDELFRLDKTSTPVAERDALKLLAALVQHADNGANQNEMICLPENVIKGASGTVTDCKQAILYVQDLGGTFGGGGPVIHNGGAANFEKWKNASVWKNADSCRFNLIPAGPPLLSHLRTDTISRDGRDFLLQKLDQISSVPEKLENLFRAAGMDTGGFHPENHSAREWADVLRTKIQDIRNAACQPEDHNGYGTGG